MYGYIYLTTNNINGHIYIGKKKSEIFLNNKYLGSGKYLTNAVKKYGKEDFSVKLIEKCFSLESLNDREKYWIKYYRSNTNFILYNISEGGDGGKLTPNGGHHGCKLSEESKMKISLSLMGHITSEETKQKLREANLGKKHTIQTKHKISEANKIIKKGHKMSEQTKQKLREANLGKKHTQETKQKIAESAKGRKLSKQTKQKISNTLKNLYNK